MVVLKDQDVNSALVPDAPPGESQFLLAKINRGIGDADAAIEAYSQASLTAPKDFDIAKEYGMYLLQLSQNDKARSELRRAYALNPKDQQVAEACGGSAWCRAQASRTKRTWPARSSRSGRSRRSSW